MHFVLDNLILNVKKVSYEQYNNFISEVSTTLMTEFWDDTIVKRYEQLRAKDYHFNAQIGTGGGASFIGYQHNSEKPDKLGFTLKLETNPNKPNDEQKMLMQLFAKHFHAHELVIKGGDLALDIPIDLKRIIIVSNTGRMQDRHKGTLYYGTRGKHGYLKAYDKKKEYLEKQGKQIEDEYLTRLEYSFRFKEGLTLEGFRTYCMDLDKMYKVSLFSPEKMDNLNPLLRACIFSYINGFQDIKEFTYTYKTKIKKALDAMDPLQLDTIYQESQKQIFAHLIKFTTNPELTSI